MNAELWQQARPVFEQALDFESEQRLTFLEEACAENQELREFVDSMIAAHELSDDFLEPPTSAQLRGDTHASIGMPDRVGAYTLVQKIGAGGMGTIYEAQQDAPQRKVALKIMRECVSTDRARGRFLFEAEVLGRLQHENIARVLESGIHGSADQNQLPWFALEYVEGGLSILEYANAQKLSTSGRIQLFLKACAGVQHGHQKGVIHRDLKATNILVGPDGMPKVIDFGVACLIESEMENEEGWTLSGEVVGTLGTMSPEQLRGSRKDVDICTDVYSLGALLFELLAGEPALDLKGLSLPAAFELARKGKVRSLEEVKPNLPRELGWIAQRAMEHERGHRYSTVSDMMADLHRFLSNQAVLAGPPTRSYHLKKFVSRYRWPVIGLTTILFVLVGALFWVSSIYRVADRERIKSVAINEFMNDTLSTANPSVGGADTRISDALDYVYESSAVAFKDQPGVRVELLEMVGRVYSRLNEHNNSRRHLEEAVALQRANGKEDDLRTYRMMGMIGENLAWEGEDLEGAVALLREAHSKLVASEGAEAHETLIVQSLLGFALSESNLDEEAEKHLRASYEASVRLLGETAPETTGIGSRLGQFLYLMGQMKEAEALARLTYQSNLEHWGPEHSDTLSAGNNLAGLLLKNGRASEGLELMHDVHDRARRSYGPKRHLTQRLATVLGNVMMGARDFQGARDRFALAVEECSEHFGDLHSLTLVARLGLGTAAYYLGDMVTAEKELRLGLLAQEKTLGESAPATVTTRNNLGMMLQAAGMLEESKELLSANLAIRRQKYGDMDPGTLQAIHNMGFLLVRIERFEEGKTLLDEALAGRRKLFGDTHPATLESMMNAADARLKLGDPAAAIPLWEAVLNAGPKAFGPDSPRLETCRKGLAEAKAQLE